MFRRRLQKINSTYLFTVRGITVVLHLRVELKEPFVCDLVFASSGETGVVGTSLAGGGL